MKYKARVREGGGREARGGMNGGGFGWRGGIEEEREGRKWEEERKRKREGHIVRGVWEEKSWSLQAAPLNSKA